MGLCAVYGSCEVGEVVTEFHGLVVHSVHPTSQHGHFGGRVCVQCVTCVAEMLEGNGHVRLCGIDVLRNTCAQQQFATVAVVHEQLDGAQGAVALAYNVAAGVPREHILANSVAIFVGAIDEAFVLPAVAP